MRDSSPIAVVRSKLERGWRWAVPVAVCIVSLACLPNGIAHGSRSAPYCFFATFDHWSALCERHSLALLLDRATTVEQFRARYVPRDDYWEELRAFNHEFGLELPESGDGQVPAGVPIWWPPERRTESMCFVWIHSTEDGWISLQQAGDDLRHLEPNCSHAPTVAPLLSVSIYPVPARHQREWSKRSLAEFSDMWDPKALPEDLADIRDLVDLMRAPQHVNDRRFHVRSWVQDRSKVAKIAVELPIAEVNGRICFAQQPTLHWLDAYGQPTPPYEPVSSPIALALASATGGALLGFAAFAVLRRRRESAT